jgi:hypothetical protein
MENIQKGTPKDVFLHLLSAATLYLSVVSFITLWWQYINFAFPDKLNVLGAGSSVYNPILWATSALAVGFPVFVLISWILGREFKIEPAKRETRVRKWLWYLTLFISAVTIIIDLVTLVYNFLRGDLTTQFFLKLMVILVVTAAVFGYYLWDLRTRTKASNKPKKIAWISAAVILTSIIYGFFLVGTPATQRNRRFDEQRVSDLQQIQNSVVNYWQQKNQIPDDLTKLKTIGYGIPTDPETNLIYEYSATGDLSFKLCADFKTAVKQNAYGSNYPYYSSPVGIAVTPQNWAHEAGRTCFDSTIDKTFYKQPGNPGPVPVPLKY